MSEGNSKPTKILRITYGDSCPVCKKVAIDCIVTIINRFGQKERILAVNCTCGTVYLTRDQYNKLSSPKAYDIELRDTTPLLPKSKIMAKSSSEQKKKLAPTNNTLKYDRWRLIPPKKASNSIMEICPKCHYQVSSLFADSGMCWDCYKEQMSSRFE